jgi:hypothetical protein
LCLTLFTADFVRFKADAKAEALKTTDVLPSSMYVCMYVCMYRSVFYVHEKLISAGLENSQFCFYSKQADANRTTVVVIICLLFLHFLGFHYFPPNFDDYNCWLFCVCKKIPRSVVCVQVSQVCLSVCFSSSWSYAS